MRLPPPLLRLHDDSRTSPLPEAGPAAPLPNDRLQSQRGIVLPPPLRPRVDLSLHLRRGSRLLRRLFLLPLQRQCLDPALGLGSVHALLGSLCTGLDLLAVPELARVRLLLRFGLGLLDGLRLRLGLGRRLRLG